MRLYRATRIIKGKQKTLQKNDLILLDEQQASRLVARGALVEVDPAAILEETIRRAGGKIHVRSTVLGETVVFALEQSTDEYITYLPQELAEILLKKTPPQTLKTIHEIKKILNGTIVRSTGYNLVTSFRSVTKKGGIAHGVRERFA